MPNQGDPRVAELISRLRSKPPLPPSFRVSFSAPGGMVRFSNGPGAIYETPRGTESDELRTRIEELYALAERVG